MSEALLGKVFADIRAAGDGPTKRMRFDAGDGGSFTFAVAAYNLLRLPKRMATPTVWARFV